MYRRLYRQEGGGLGGLNPHDYMRQEVDKYVQDYNQRNQGEVAARVMPRPVPIPSPIISQNPRDTITQRIKEGFSSLIKDPIPNYNPMAEIAKQVMNKSELDKLESEPQYGPGYTGKPSDARHQAASNEISKSVSNLIDKGSFGLVPEKFRDFLGDIVPNLGGGIKELVSLGYNVLPTGDVTPSEAFDMFKEDIAANYKGSFGTDNTKTAREIYEDVYKEQSTNNPYIGASHNSPMWFGGYPLQSGDTLTAEKMRMNRQGHTRDYRIPPNLKLQYNDDGTGTIVSRPADEMQESTPGYTTENWWKALRHYNPNYEEDRSNYFNREDSNRFIQQQEQPINTGGFGVDFTNSNRDLINATDFNLLQNYYQGQQ